jgi:hypothetical protein
MVFGVKAKTKAIAPKTGNDVEVNVKHFLTSRLAIGKQQIYSFTPHLRQSNGCRQLDTQLAETTRHPWLQLSQAGHMLPRNDQQVPWIDGLNIQERH